jgi:hypothetical protein
MKNRLLIEDGEKKDILSQHDDIDPKIFNFLMRRIKIIEREVGVGFGDIEQLKVNEYRFYGYPGYGFSSYDSKRLMESKIIEMLYENDITDYIYDMNEQNPERQKIIKTIRKFLNFILVDQK